MILEHYMDIDSNRLSLNYTGCNGGKIQWKSRDCMPFYVGYPDDVIEECRTVIDIMIDKLVEARRRLDTLGHIT